MTRILFFSIVLLALGAVSVPAYALNEAECTGEVIGSVCVPTDTGLAKTEIGTILANVADWIVFLFSSIAIVVLIVCGFQYLVSAGDDSQAENAKRCMKWAIVGFVVAGLAFVVLKLVADVVMDQGPGGIFG